MTCYELAPGTAAPKITSVTAGSTFTFSVDPTIAHPGPLQFYMAKAPSGKTAQTFDGKGAVWFKIYQDGPSGLGTSSITWPSTGKSACTGLILSEADRDGCLGRQDTGQRYDPQVRRKRRLPPPCGAHRAA